MQGSWVPISSVRPYQSMDFRVNPNLAEQGAITKWTKQFALQKGLEINRAFCKIPQEAGIFKVRGKRGQVSRGTSLVSVVS